MSFQVTHIDINGHRRRFLVRNVPNNGTAIHWAEQLFGEARYLAVMTLRRPT